MGDLNAKEAADALGVHYQTVRNWIRAGDLRAAKNESNEWRVPLEEVERIRQAREDGGKTAASAVAAAGFFADWHSRELEAARLDLMNEIRRLADLPDDPAALLGELDALRGALERLDTLKAMLPARAALHRAAIMHDRAAGRTGGWVGDENDPGPRIRETIAREE